MWLTTFHLYIENYRLNKLRKLEVNTLKRAAAIPQNLTCSRASPSFHYVPFISALHCIQLIDKA